MIIPPANYNNVSIYANQPIDHLNQTQNTPSAQGPTAATEQTSQQAATAQYATAQSAAVAVTSAASASPAPTSSATPTSSIMIGGTYEERVHAIQVWGGAGRAVNALRVTPEMHGQSGPAFIYGAHNIGTRFIYDFARDHLGIEDSAERERFTQDVFFNAWSADAGVRSGNFFAMEHLIITNVSDTDEAISILTDFNIMNSAARLFWEEGYFITESNGTPTLSSVADSMPNFFADGDLEANRAERWAMNRLAQPVFFHQSPHTFQEDWVNILANDGRQDAADAVQRLFDRANSGQGSVMPEMPTVPPVDPPTPPVTPPADPPAETPPIISDDMYRLFRESTISGEVEYAMWNNMSRESQNRVLAAFETRLHSHENRLQFQALFTYMSIQYNPAFREAVNNGTLSFHGDLADRLVQLGAELPNRNPAASAAAPSQTAEAQAPETVTAQIEPLEAASTAEGFSFNWRDLLEERNALLMEFFRNLNSDEDMTDNPIMQILAANNMP